MKKIETDVVVISAGTAGLAATVTLAEQGVKVIAVEKNGSPGGNGNLANGPFAVESRLQRERMLDLTAEEAYEQFMQFTAYDVNGALVKHFIDKSADTIDWLEAMGVEFEGLGRHGHGMNETWHLVKPLEGTDDKGLNGGYIVIKRMKEKADSLGAQILLKTEVTHLIQENGKVVGVKAEDKDGEVEIRCKAVISAAGGYGAYWRKPMGIPLFGDGLRMAKEVGAEVTDGTMVPVRKDDPPVKMFGDGPAPFMFPHINGMGGQPNLVVNPHGNRFANEYDLFVDPRGCNSIKWQPKGIMWNIFSEDILNLYMEKGFDFIEGYGIRKMASGPLSRPDKFYDDLERSKEFPMPLVHIADSVEELAKMIRVPEENLKKTLDKYNSFCDHGVDKDFGKRAKYLRPLRGKLFALPIRMILGVGYPEGIIVSDKLEAVTPEKNVIPGLYAAGMDCCRSIWADAYVNILPGNAFGWALNSGRMAGEYAAEYVRSI